MPHEKNCLYLIKLNYLKCMIGRGSVGLARQVNQSACTYKTRYIESFACLFIGIERPFENFHVYYCKKLLGQVQSKSRHKIDLNLN